MLPGVALAEESDSVTVWAINVALETRQTVKSSFQPWPITTVISMEQGQNLRWRGSPAGGECFIVQKVREPSRIPPFGGLQIEFHVIKFLGLICLAVLCVILSLGLWPFHVPANDVTWQANRNGLRFGKYGTVLSSRDFTKANDGDEASSSLEVWLQPRRIWDSGTFLAFYARGNPFRLSLRQWQSDLALGVDSDHSRQAALLVRDVFLRRTPVFLTITTGWNGTTVYVDGLLANQSRELQIPSNEFTGRLIVAAAALQSDSWSGQLLGLALYHRELSAPEVQQSYEHWTRLGRQPSRGDERNAALYLFDEHGGNVVHDRAGSGVDLQIPERYVVVDQIFLESPWSEFNRSTDFSGAVLKNIVGFVPFGFCFYAYLRVVRRHQRAALLTVILGILVSLTIEILQAFIPTRASGMMDLVTNTLGTYLGIVLYKVAGRILSIVLPPFPSTRGQGGF